MKDLDKKELHLLFEEFKNSSDEKSYSLLYEKYKKLVYNIAFCIIKNRENSEDIVQIVFSKIWKIDKKLLPSNSEASWLYSVTKNETLNYLKINKSHLNLDDIYYINNEDEEINKIIDKDKYNKMISNLDKKGQEVVSLKLISGLSFKEISNILKEPIGTIQWRYYNSLHSLKAIIANSLMFILSISLYFSERKKNKKREVIEEKEHEENIENNINENIGDNVATGDRESEIEEDYSENEQTKSESQDIEKNTIANNEIIENIVIDDKVQETDFIEIGLLSLSGVFLLTTIFFSIIFIKYQQNLKKKMSK